ncbi:hypothetical protein SSX86_012490 [Deinandra increscens subsp. villosa]|uniref:Protein kinase domain-containing protein n=1 Tax=Deinandra increscens subsp. villosa TaxID=3103831 RepID=A0AAP0D8U2_9ASTR
MASTMPVFADLRIPLEEVLKATNNFHDDNIIGHGDFGPAYKGQLLWSGKSMKIVARRLDRKHGLGDSAFLTEVSMLSNLKHTNLVSIIGFCEEKGEKIIINTYEANGSLERFLDSPNFTWTQRLRVCLGVARALSYLHSYEGRDYAVIHRFINSSTILLDENWEAKLSGFEISIKQPIQRKDQVLLCDPIGKVEYTDPATEKTNGVTHKSDIYSLGVVLFELLCGRKAFIWNEADRFLPPLAKHHYENKDLQDIIHPDLWNQMSQKSLLHYSKVAYACLKEERAHRPDTKNLIDELEKSLEFQLRRENLVRPSLFSF